MFTSLSSVTSSRLFSQISLVRLVPSGCLIDSQSCKNVANLSDSFEGSLNQACKYPNCWGFTCLNSLVSELSLSTHWIHQAIPRIHSLTLNFVSFAVACERLCVLSGFPHELVSHQIGNDVRSSLAFSSRVVRSTVQKEELISVLLSSILFWVAYETHFYLSKFS